MINNVYYDSAARLASQNGGITYKSEAEVITARATVAIAFEARTQTLIALYGILEPGLDRQKTLIEILERIYE